MVRSTSISLWTIPLLFVALASDLNAQRPPYDVFPPADPPYYRVRYEGSTRKGELVYPVNYTIWVPKGVNSLRGVIVHQHGCGEGSCKSGLTGAYDLHWQALARKHDCALLSPSYEQPDKADCQMWCDPRNGSAAAFQKCLVDLGAKSGHPELSKIPWALWGHSGGGHWAGGMVLLHPERVAAAWLRSGVPLLKADPERTTIKAHTLPDAALKVPVMCNLGTKEGVTVKDGRFAGVWPANEAFFNAVRSKGGLISVAVDPLSSHECGNQRYLAIPWLDACLSARLPKVSGAPLNAMPTDRAWLAPITGGKAVRAEKFAGDPLQAAWLPNETIAKAWMQYVQDTEVSDTTPPPAPTNLRLNGNELTWEAEADLESGVASFLVERDGQFLAKVPEQGKNPFGRPIFQNLQYSDTPTQPLVPMRYTDTNAQPGQKHAYRVIAVNTVGLKSLPSDEQARASKNKTVRLLTVGNSFSQNATRYLGDLVKANGHTLIHRPLAIGGASMEVHWVKAQLHEKDPKDPKGLYGKKSLREELMSDAWDVVTIQQASIKSHDVATYRPFARQLYDYIKKAAPKAEVLVHQTWAYRVDDPRFAKPSNTSGEPSTQKEMYDGLTKAYTTIAGELGVRMIPVGDAMYRADTNAKWGYKPDKKFNFKDAEPPALPDQTHSLHTGWRWTAPKEGKRSLAMDGHHASVAGQYLAACVFYEVLFAQSVVGNSFVPQEIDREYARFLQETAHQAVIGHSPRRP